MKSIRKSILLLICLSVGVFVFTQYGRSIWHPVVLKIKGRKTIEQVTSKLDPELFPKLLPSFKRAGFEYYPNKITLIGIKDKKILELWGRHENQNKWTLIKTYPFTGYSGKLGPKLKEGDRQIPEGIYNIEYLNPNSSYHLSMKVNYPNSFERKTAQGEGRTNLGGDIMIHGNQVTIGCIPIGDAGIEEVFLCVAKAGKENCKVILSPTDFRKNKDYPNIEHIEWEATLYAKIKQALQPFRQ